MKTIYLVEDEKSLCILLEKYLVHENYDVKTFSDGLNAMAQVTDTPHLWILDINLPGHTGYELIEAIKAHHPYIPVIFMSARNEELDRVIGLELGSDDYLPKPFMPRELVIRTKKLLERVYGNEEQKKRVAFGPYTVMIEERMIHKNGQDILLTTKEFDLVLYFIETKNCVVTREQILLKVWGNDYFGSDRVVDDTVRRLRKKLEDSGIETIYGYGYKWVSRI